MTPPTALEAVQSFALTMRKPYSLAQQTEAIALGRILGIEGAAEQLGIDRRTVRKWSEQAGDAPELQGEAGQLTRIRDLAFARVESLLGAGRLNGPQAATVGAIAARVLRDQERAVRVQAQTVLAETADPDDFTPLTTAARQRFTVWVDSLPAEDGRTVVRDIQLELTRRASEGDPVPSDALETDAEGAARWDAIREATAADLPGIAARVAEAEAQEAARRHQRELANRWLDDDAADLLIEAEALLEEIAP